MTARRPRVLIVDDEELLRLWLTEQLQGAGFTTLVASGRSEAVRLAQREAPAVVLLDLRLPDTRGLEALEELRAVDSDMVIIIMTAYGEIETAVAAVKAGAYHFLQKPLAIDQLLVTLETALEAARLRSQVDGLRQMHRWSSRGTPVVAQSRAMRRVMDWVEKAAAADPATVLLLGESGTGKSLIARAIHDRSPRQGAPFLRVPCTAIPESLFESELFGHERGAFSGARERKRGLLEVADGGTVLLDEIGDVPVSLQVKLLGFLDTRTFRRVGGVADLGVEVRIVAATSRDLEIAAREDAFRPDLYYRLNVLPQRIPPLRDRREDIAPLARHLLEELSREFHRPPPPIAPDTIARLEAHDWPGNVRELRNVIERMLLLGDGSRLNVDQAPLEGHARDALPPATTGASGSFALPPEGLDIEALERQLIADAMRASGGNKTRAASLLGLTRDTLRYRLEKYGIVSD